MELLQVFTLATTVVEHKDVLLGLGVINKQHRGKESEIYSGLVANEKLQISEGDEIVRAHKQAITGFMPR